MQEVAGRDIYFNDRVFVTKKKIKLSKEDFDFLFQIFLESDNMKSLVPNPNKTDLEINFIDSNLSYDIYSFQNLNDPVYILKVAVGESPSLEKEFEILKKISNLELSPSVFFYENLINYSNIKILVCSYEYGSNFKELHNINLFNSISLIGENLKKVHSIKGESSDYDNFINFYKNLINFKDNLSEEINKNLNRSYVFRKSISISSKLLEKAEQEILNLDDDFLSNFSLCHSNIQKGSVLLNNGNLKFLNFYSSFQINPLFDLGFTSLYLGLNSQSEKKLIDSYLLENSNIDQTYIDVYFERVKCICWKIILCKIIALSFYEKLIHKYERMNKHIYIYDLYMNIRGFLKENHPYYLKYFDKAIIFFS